ncbi:MAG TPA: glycosyltransferase family 39 protein [Ktedonobacterales bacterium]
MLAILAGALLLRILPLGVFSTEYDEGVYWLSLRAMAQGHALYSSIYYAQPPFFLLSIYPIFVLLGQTLVAARFVVALYSLLGIVALYLIGKGLGGRYVGLIAALVLAVDPVYLLISRTLDAEAPAIALMLVGIALGVEALPRRGRARQVVIALSGVILGLATMTKLFAVVGVVPIALLLAWPGVVRVGARPFDQQRHHAQRSRLLHAGVHRTPVRDAARGALVDSWPELAVLLAGFVVACAVVLAPFLGSTSALYSQAIGLHLDAAHTLNQGIGYNLTTIAGQMRGLTGEPFAVLWLLLAAVTFPFWRRSPIAMVVVVWGLASLLVLAAQQPLFEHHIALLAPPVALLAALLVYWSMPLGKLGRVKRAGATTRTLRALAQPTVLLYAALILLGASLVVNLIGSAQQIQAAIAYPATQQVLTSFDLGTSSVPGEPVVTDDPYLAGLAGRTLPPQLIDTSLVRIRTGSLTAMQVEDIVTSQGIHVILFENGRLDAVPGLRAWVQQNFAVSKDYGGGRVLYVKRPPPPVNV